MSETEDAQQTDRTSGKRGEAAWKEDRERIAARNDEARKAGKQRREDYERRRAEARQAADVRRRAALLKKARD
jgi:hypothetical protein